MPRILFDSLALLSLLMGCGGSTPGPTPMDSGSAPDAGAPPGEIVINEIEGASFDWVELRNNGPGPFALGGLRVTDDAAGSPALLDAATFVADEVLAAGEYLVIVGDISSPAAGPQTMCLGITTRCYQAAWGITSGGETVYLLPAAGDDTPLAEADYPGGLMMGQSWSRLPDGTGDFAAGTATPGTANAAP